MAYDPQLADRVRRLLRRKRDLTEREMFGGVAFLIRGNMACAVRGMELMVRLGPAAESAAREPRVRAFDHAGRTMKGWVIVAPGGLTSETSLRRWVDLAAAFARGLPAK